MKEKDGRARGEWIELFCFISSSARSLVGEPEIYGPFRLVDTLERIIDLLGRQGVLDDEFLNSEKEKIVEKKFDVMVNRESFIDFLDELVMDFTRELKKEEL
ncbi:MAG: hypothetical protein JXQ30_15445 [Spirochaetes bacterium]|nr:hypothetical protein [Spirochaetota bacterium]